METSQGHTEASGPCGCPVGEPGPPGPMGQTVNEACIAQNKQWRKSLDVTLQEIKNAIRKSRHRSLSITHLEDAIMRLGMDLKELGNPNPYPTSYDPSSKVVESTADGLKL